MGDGTMFLPVRAEIRKKIGKQAGDSVQLVLYDDDFGLEVPQEIIDCFECEPREVYSAFIALNDFKRKAYLDWIYDAKSDEIKVRRIIEMIDRIRKTLSASGKGH
jgi:uncharacterized protein YdeI (YjbR/CyaY-like superfamily)